MVRVKICGITTRDDAEAAASFGADALGFVFVSSSARAVSPDAASRIVSSLAPFVVTVGVFVNETVSVVNDVVRRVGLDRVQLHGDETPDYCEQIVVPVIKAFRVRNRDVLKDIPRFSAAAFLLDAYSGTEYGGTGTRFDWDIAREAAVMGRLVLSGGLSAVNVREAVERVKPYGVDVSTGVSLDGDPRRKDRRKMKQFIEEARCGWEKAR